MNEDAELKIKTLTDSLARLEADFDTLSKEVELLKRLESAVIAWSRVKIIKTMEKSDYELCRKLIELGMERHLRFFMEGNYERTR